MACVSEGLIVGGGIAGLASALALARAGVHCEVVDLGDAPVGAGMSLSGGATQALTDLGIYDECHDSGSPFRPEMSSPVMMDASGAPLGPPPPPMPPRPGSRPPLGVFRPTFAGILESAALAAGATLRRGVTIEEIRDTSEGSQVLLSTGERRRFDFVIGADGIGSRTRSLIFPDAPEPAYAGQMSIRWMLPGPALSGEGWYVSGELGRLGFFHMPKQDLTYVPMVLNRPEGRLSQDEAYQAARTLLDSYTAPAVVDLASRLRPDSTLIARPFRWLLLPAPWHRGRTLLIGDAAHATTAHLGMGAGMALEDAVVLGECIAAADSLPGAYETFTARRYERVRAVVQTSVALAEAEVVEKPQAELDDLRGGAMRVLARPY